MTNETKHTPGPWEPELHEGCWRITTYADGAKVVTAAVHGDDDFSPVYAANARLIAAAPELEYELGGIADALSAGETVLIEPGSVKASRIHAAIAKVTGEEVAP